MQHIAHKGPFAIHLMKCSNISQQNKETTTLIQTIVDVQPRAGGGGGGETPDQIVWRICDQTRSSVIHKIDRSLINPALMEPDDMGQLNSLTTVLLHESERFNTLLALIHSSLNELQKAIKVRYHFLVRRTYTLKMNASNKISEFRDLLSEFYFIFQNAASVLSHIENEDI